MNSITHSARSLAALAVAAALVMGCGNDSPVATSSGGANTAALGGASGAGGASDPGDTIGAGGDSAVSTIDAGSGGAPATGGAENGGLASASGGVTPNSGGAATGGTSPIETTLAVGGASGGGVGGSSTTPRQPVVGSVQKGPFIRDTTLIVQELDGQLSPNGRLFTFGTDDDLGHFTLPTNVASRYVEVIANGYYFDELANQLSTSQLTLRTISDISNATEINVNLLTSLAATRERKLVSAGQSFGAACAQAEREVLSALNFNGASSTTFDRMDITQTGETNGLLLAASVLLEELAFQRSATSPVAELSQLLANIASDVAADGVFDDAMTASQLKCVVPAKVDKAAVRTNLQNRIDALGGAGNVPAFEQFLVVASDCCTPETRRCSSNQAEICNFVGQWTPGIRCAGDTPNCKDGYCESSCTPDARRCIGKDAQICDANGLWQNKGECAWGSRTLIDTTGNVCGTPTAVVDNDGNVTAAWLSEKPDPNWPVDFCNIVPDWCHELQSLKSAQYSPSSGWTKATLMDPSDGSVQVEALTAEPAGKAMLAWTQLSSTSGSVWSREFDPTSASWGAAELVDGDLVDAQTQVGLALMGSTPVAVWAQDGLDDHSLHAATFDPDLGWSLPVVFDSDLRNVDPNPSEVTRVTRVAALSASEVLAVWAHRYGALSNMTASHYSPASGWSAPLTIGKETAAVFEIALTTDSAGSAIALWANSADHVSDTGLVYVSSNIWANLYRTASGWGNAELLVSGTQDFFANGLSVAFDSDGNALATWIAPEGVMACRNVKGSGWQAVEPLPTGVGVTSSPSMVMGSHGRATIVWCDQSGTNTRIWFDRFTPGSGWSVPELLQNLPTDTQSTQLVVDSSGRLTLITHDCANGNASMAQVWAQRFE